MKKIATTQRDLVGNQQAAWSYFYQAELATKPARFVPRNVLASKTGVLISAIDCSDEPENYLAVQKEIDLPLRKAKKEIKDRDFPFANSIAYPNALAVNGASIITTDVENHRKPVFVEQHLSNRKVLSTFSQLEFNCQFVATNKHWVAIEDAQMHAFDYGSSKATSTFSKPRNLFGWGAKAAVNADLVALTGDGGLIGIADTSTGSMRRFFPHRGCRRNDSVCVAISEDGEWMASKVFNRRELMLTDLTNGHSWQVGDLEDQTIINRQDGDNKSQSIISAAFNFVGSRLLVSEGRKVRELDISKPENAERIFVSEQGKPGARKPMKLSPKATYEKIIKEARLDNSETQLRDFHYPACKIVTKKSKKSGWYTAEKKAAPGLGESRLGGWPDLPKGTPWPTWEGRPMAFLGQLDLAEMAGAQPDLKLPHIGVLLFFIGCSEETFDSDRVGKQSYMIDLLLGENSRQKGGWKVLYAKNTDALERVIYQGDCLPELFNPCAVRLVKGGLGLPNEHAAAYDCLNLSDGERENYNEVLDLICEEDAENQLSGYPALLQSTPPEFFCSNASSDKPPFEYPDEGSGELRELLDNASDWGLLLQLTSDDKPDFLWGDGGHLYFYGYRKEMENGNFDNCWIFFEN